MWEMEEEVGRGIAVGGTCPGNTETIHTEPLAVLMKSTCGDINLRFRNYSGAWRDAETL